MPHTGTCTALHERKDDSDNMKMTEKEDKHCTNQYLSETVAVNHLLSALEAV